MGLQGQLSDLSSDSFPILVVSIIAHGVSYLRSLLFTILHSLGILDLDHEEVIEEELVSAVGAGLAGLVALSEQLNLNRVFSYPYSEDGGSGHDCVVCLCELSEGDSVRKLACGHVFHKDCFDGWLDGLHFNCPLCRLPLEYSDEPVASTGRRVTGDLLYWLR